MAWHKSESYREAILHPQPGNILAPLFEKAKTTDEFEFACTLLRIKGMQDPGWDPLLESNTLTKQLTSLIEGPIATDFRVRLVLFLYCHLTEMPDLYNIVANLLRVCSGERYSYAPFGTRPFGSKKRLPSPSAKVTKIVQWSHTAGMPEVGELMKEMLIREVRNAFYHSSYILRPDAMNISDGDGVPIENVQSRQVMYSWLMPRLELGINTALATVDFALAHIRSYTSDRLVRGRFRPDGTRVDIQLTTTPNYGLTGFRSPPSVEFLAATSSAATPPTDA